MKTLIKIDRRTIKANHNAGKTSFQEPTPIEVTVHYNGLIPDKWKDAFIMTTQDIDNVKGTTSVWNNIRPIKKSELTKLSKDKKTDSIQAHRELRTFHSRTPDPSHFFKYRNTPVQCSSCLKGMPHTMVIEDYVDGGGYYKTCPYCGEQDTFDYEFEKIEDVLEPKP